MELRPIERENWQLYLDQLSRSIQGNYVEIEVASLGTGDQIEEAWIPLIGLSYDPKEEILFVHTEQFERAIHNPKEVVALHDAGMHVRSISIKDAEGNVNTVNFRAPILIEAGQGAGVSSPPPP